MDVVFDVTSQISLLHFGEILKTGTPEQIHSSAKVQEIYLGRIDAMTILEVQDIHTYSRHGWNIRRVYTLFPRLLERRNQHDRRLCRAANS